MSTDQLHQHRPGAAHHARDHHHRRLLELLNARDDVLTYLEQTPALDDEEFLEALRVIFLLDQKIEDHVAGLFTDQLPPWLEHKPAHDGHHRPDPCPCCDNTPGAAPANG